MKFYGHAQWIVNLNKCDQMFNSHLGIKVTVLILSIPICLYREAMHLHAFAMFSAHMLREWAQLCIYFIYIYICV